jgi:putative transcriptional regulator
MFAAARPASQLRLRHIHLHSNQEPAAGRFLVASSKLNDPNFRRTVVLLLAADGDRGSLGVIINRRSKLPLSRVFPDLKSPGNIDPKDVAFAGGPVEFSSVQALLRSVSSASNTEHVIGDVYSTADKELIEKSISSGADSKKLRVYLGYAGWAPDQLETEIDIGAWFVMRASPEDIFDEDPDSLWSRLNRKVDSEIARNYPFITVSNSLRTASGIAHD